MDEDLQKIEDELKCLRPARVPASLMARMQRELGPALAPVAAKTNAIRWWWVAALPAAAAVLLIFNLMARKAGADRPVGAVSTVAAPSDETLKPVAAENVLYAAEDEGIVTLDDGRPARRERLHFVDTVTWRNPRTHASLTWSVPREEVRIVPVTFQ